MNTDMNDIVLLEFARLCQKVREQEETITSLRGEIAEMKETQNMLLDGATAKDEELNRLYNRLRLQTNE